MKIAIASTALATIVAHAAAALPEEACGIVVGTPDRITEAVPATNVASAPTTTFEIDAATLFRTYRSMRTTGQTVIGWYHSHPDGVGQPSAIDATRAVEDGKLWVIVAAGAVSAWRTDRDGRLHGRFTPVDLAG